MHSNYFIIQLIVAVGGGQERVAISYKHVEQVYNLEKHKSNDKLTNVLNSIAQLKKLDFVLSRLYSCRKIHESACTTLTLHNTISIYLTSFTDKCPIIIWSLSAFLTSKARWKMLCLANREVSFDSRNFSRLMRAAETKREQEPGFRCLLTTCDLQMEVATESKRSTCEKVS